MTYVKLTNVRAFPGVKPTKEQALKVLGWDELAVSYRGDCIEALEEIIHDLEGLE